MKKKELLSPVGNFESLKMAVYHGCDAVYLGGKRFGARAFAANFSDEEMKEAVFFCHLYGVKIYVTVNTMIYESELPEVLNYVKFLYQIHVDAVIMADVGLMKLAHEMMPNLEIHASTQVHTHNVAQIEVLRDIGVKRVVLARELTLEEILSFPNDLEIEVFIHGALCISYSGQCLFSSMILHRSGNRGECAQICRLPFQLLENGKPITTKGNFLLSTKDLNASELLPKLMDSNVTSFKIEGRMKSPAYVGFMTKFYRNLMNQYQLQHKIEIDLKDLERASLLFHRGFTTGCLNSSKDSKFMNQETSNHQGVYLGNVETVESKRIGIRLARDIHQGDGIRFASLNQGMIVNFLYHSNGKLISSAKKGELIFLDNKFSIQKSESVLKTYDILLEEEILSVLPKKIPITMNIRVAMPTFFVEISDGEHVVSLERDIVSMAKTSPISKEMIQKQFQKLGDTPFSLQEIQISLEDNLFVMVSQMNELRRDVVEQLKQARVYRSLEPMKELQRSIEIYSDDLEILASVQNENQLKMLLSLGISSIYVSDYSLYQKYSKQGAIYRTNRVSHKTSKLEASEILAGESGSFVTFSGNKSVDYFFNVANHATIDYWIQKGAKRVCLSAEVGLEELKNILSFYPKGNSIEIIVYGRLEVMVLNHCIMRMNLHEKGPCNLCQENVYSLQDRNGANYPIVMDENHRTHLYYHSIFDKLEQLSLYYEIGIRKFRLEFFDESEEEIRQVVSQVKKMLNV